VSVGDSLTEAWDDWLAAQKEAGEKLRSAAHPGTALDLAEGHRYLSRLASTALWTFVEHADPLWPSLYRNTDEHKKFGLDNPDNVYLRCALDGEHSYRLHGWRGEAPYFGITVGGEFFGGSGGPGTLSQHHLEDFEIADDGTFELVLSPEEQGGNWIRLEPETTGMILRQTFFDRATQRPAELAIERVGATGSPPPLSTEHAAEGLRRAAGFLRGVTGLFLRMADGWAQRPNTLVGASGESTRRIHGDPDIFYAAGYWSLAPDEALVVDVSPARSALLWSFQIANHWLESLDYEHHPVATNSHRAATRSDGSATLVVAHRDPGVPNWIDTAGHAAGTMCFRWLLAEPDPPLPGVRVAKLGELGG
jgi:hypothetical protein